MRERGGYRVNNDVIFKAIARERYGSVAELAKHAQVSRQFMSRLLQGRKTCRASVVQSVARALDVPAYMLFVDADGEPAELPPMKREQPTA